MQGYGNGDRHGGEQKCRDGTETEVNEVGVCSRNHESNEEMTI